MPLATFRFYEELNDFLPEHRRKRTFRYACPARATVKHAIEALGVPHTEVELILVDGHSVDFSHVVGEGERVSVYPKFEALDVTPLLKVRGEPLRRVRFIADAHLGGLAKYLRMLGFDTRLGGAVPDAVLVRVALDEGRVVLTRDRDLLKRREVTHGCYVHAAKPRAQVREVVARLDLHGAIRPFTRCLRCNGELRAAPKESMAERLPARVLSLYDRFRVCAECERVYWEGSHHQNMEALLEELLGERGGSRGAGPATPVPTTRRHT